MRLVNRQAKISVEAAASGPGGRLLPWHCEAVLFSRRCGPSPTRRSTSSSKPKAWVMRSGYRPIGCCKTRLAASSSARSGDRRRRCAATMPAFATKPAHGQSPDEWWSRSSGIRVSFIRASALSSPTWRGRWSVSSPSITTAAPASSTSLSGGILDCRCARRSARRQVGTKGWSISIKQRDGRRGWSRAGGVPNLVGGVEQSLLFEQGAGHRQQAVGDGAQGAVVAVAALAQRGITAAAERVALGCQARPMIERGREPLIAGITAHDDAGFAAAAGHRGPPGQAAQGMIISPAQRLADLAEQHGEDYPSEPRHGSQDHHVALLAALPRLVLLGRDELGAEFVQLAVRYFQLLIHQPDADGQRADMVARRLDHPGCDRQRLLFEDAQDLGGLPTAEAVRFDKPLDGGLTQPDRLRRCRCLAPQIEKPIRRGRQRARSSAGNSARAAHAC